jgi:hypothetical protein
LCQQKGSQGKDKKQKKGRNIKISPLSYKMVMMPKVARDIYYN